MTSNLKAKFLVSTKSNQSRDKIVGLISKLPGTEVEIVDPSNLEAVEAEIASFSSPLVFVGDASSYSDILELAALFSSLRPDSSSVLLSEHQDADLLAEAMRAGVRFVTSIERLNQEDFSVLSEAAADATQRWKQLSASQPEKPADRKSAKVISVISPKGGVGKTTLATNIAVGLAKLNPNKVILVDLDLQFGDVSTALQLNPSHTLVDVVKGPAKSDTLVLKTFLTDYKAAKLFVIPGSLRPEEGSSITSAEVTHLLEQLRELFEYVVFDTAPGFPDYVVNPLLASDVVAVVTELDVPSIRGTKKALEVLDKLGISKNRRHVVVNKSKRGTGIVVRDVEKLFGEKPALILPRSKKVSFSTNNGVPILASDDLNRVRRRLRKYIASLSQAVPKGRKKPSNS